METCNPGFHHWLSLDNLKSQSHTWVQGKTRPSHSKKEVEAALKHAEEQGWRVEVGGAHAWGRIYCPYNDDECRCGEFCIASVWSTPRNPGSHARALRRVVDKCSTHADQRETVAED